LIGKTIAHYKIIEKLGEGGMGVVFRAHDEKLGRDVALKVLAEGVSPDSGHHNRFEREARTIAALKHPNIITVHSVEEVEGVRFITMEYMEGGTLADEITEGGLPLNRLLDTAGHVVDALAKAHREGVVHRDLKPANIMRDADGQLKILDFGLAKLHETALETDETIAGDTDGATMEGTILGTAAYMSPEQAEGHVVDARSDVFTLGIVLYEMATGRRPFSGSSTISTLSAILKDEPPPIAELRPNLPGGLAAVIKRCLAKNPEERYATAADVKRDLRLVREGDSPEASVRNGGISGVKRFAVPVAVLLVFAAIVVIAMMMRGGETRAPEATDIRSLAVLPFSNLSRDASDDYFSDGITDVLTTELVRLAELKVIARNAAARFKGSTKPPAEIAEELGVEALLSGTVVRGSGQVRITAQLARAVNDQVIWADSYERSEGNVLSLQGEVARAIAGAIALELTPEEVTRLGADRSVDPRALDEYLKGRYLWNQRTGESLRGALKHFQKAVEIAPEFALGHAGVADVYLILGGYNYMEPRKAAPLVIEAMERAFALDPTAGEPHATRGDIAHHYELDLELAKRELDRAIELSPNYGTAYLWRAEVSVALKRPAEAVEYVRRGLELDPMNAFGRHFFALALSLTGKHEEAEQRYRELLEWSPGYPLSTTELVRIELARGETGAALAIAKQAVDDVPAAANLATLAVANAYAGERQEARALLKQLTELSHERWVSPRETARVHAALGDRNEALDDLRAAFEACDFQIYELKSRVVLEFESLVGDPEFEQLLNELRKRD
jgi:TolB-like protein/Tfp pilus assembly protein PilF